MARPPRHVALLFAFLLAVTAAAYAPSWHGERLWDDDAHLTRVDLQGADGLKRIWVEPGATQQYYPVTHSAFWIQHRLWGDDTFGYHLVNIGLHALSAFLIALILERLGAPGGALAATIFALHPVHVESVAWLSELKNTLSGVFFLGALLVYLRFDDRRDRRAYLAAFALFAFALLSKSVTATWPFAVLIVLWWERGRLSWRTDGLPLVPFLAMGVVAGWITATFEHSVIGAQGSDFSLSIIERVLVAGRAVWFYLGALWWPVNLSFNYPRWDIAPSVWWQYAFPLLVAVALAALWRLRHWSRSPLAGALFFVVTLGPALGFVNVYPFRFSFVADHFQYLASVGIIVVCAGGVTRLISTSRVRVPGVVLVACLAIPLGWLTWHQSATYAEGRTLYRATLASNPGSWLAHNNLAALLLHGSTADAREALDHATAAISLNPDNPAAHFNAATALASLGDAPAAIEHYRLSIAQFGPAPPPNVRLANAHRGLGGALATVGRTEDAITEWRQALVYGPGDAGIRSDLGIALAQSGRADEARRHFEAAIALEPGTADHYNNLGGARLQIGDAVGAESAFAEAIRLNPLLADARVNRGIALERLGKDAEAVSAYLRALAIGPRLAPVHNRAGVLLLRLGRRDEAIVQFRAALAVEPDYEAAASNLERASSKL